MLLVFGSGIVSRFAVLQCPLKYLFTTRTKMTGRLVCTVGEFEETIKIKFGSTGVTLQLD